MKHLITILKGGEGSGNFGHAGRPGEVGGSGEGISGHPGFPSAKQHKSLLRRGYVYRGKRGDHHVYFNPDTGETLRIHHATGKITRQQHPHAAAPGSFNDDPETF